MSLPAEDRSDPKTDETIGVQLHRRRLAAARCEPFPDGRRDPHEAVRSERLGWEELDRCAAALLYLRRAGLPGLPPPDVARALARHPDRYREGLPRRPAA